MTAMLSVILSYLLGSVSFSYLYGKWVKGIDIRRHGSGNAGATNTLRTSGLKAGILVFVLDIGKGVLAVMIGYWFSGHFSTIAILSGLAAIFGHNWPVFLKFKGGKGIATTIGVMFTLAFIPTLIAAAVAVLTIALTRYVSLGSLLLTLCLPFAVWILHLPLSVLWASIAIFILAWMRHHTNIRKLLRGEEHKLGQKRALQ